MLRTVGPRMTSSKARLPHFCIARCTASWLFLSTVEAPIEHCQVFDARSHKNKIMRKHHESGATPEAAASSGAPSELPGSLRLEKEDTRVQLPHVTSNI